MHVGCRPYRRIYVLADQELADISIRARIDLDTPVHAGESMHGPEEDEKQVEDLDISWSDLHSLRQRAVRCEFSTSQTKISTFLYFNPDRGMQPDVGPQTVF